MNRWGLRIAAGALLLCCLSACVSAPPDRPVQSDAGKRFLQQGVTAFSQADYPRAATNFTQALYFYQGLDAHEGILQSRINLAETALAMGRWQVGAAHLQRAHELAQRPGLQGLSARVDLLRARQATAVQAYAQAQALLKPLLPIFDAQDHSAKALDDTQLTALAQRAQLALMQEEATAAQWVHRLVLALNARKIHEGAVYALSLRQQARLQEQRGRIDKADDLYRQALADYKQRAERAGIGATLEQWGDACLARGQWSQAQDVFERLLPIRLWMQDHGGAARAITGLRTVARHQADAQRERVLSEGLTAVNTPGFAQWEILRRALLPLLGPELSE